MSTTPNQVIGHCGECGTAIPSNHPYAWCSKCGAGLPTYLKEKLGQPTDPNAAASPSRADGVPLVVEGYPVACPVCRHDRFRTRRTVMESRAQAIFDLDWSSPTAENYICLRCGYVMLFMR